MLSLLFASLSCVCIAFDHSCEQSDRISCVMESTSNMRQYSNRISDDETTPPVVVSNEKSIKFQLQNNNPAHSVRSEEVQCNRPHLAAPATGTIPIHLHHPVPPQMPRCFDCPSRCCLSANKKWAMRALYSIIIITPLQADRGCAVEAFFCGGGRGRLGKKGCNAPRATDF